ncbi:MAG: hypothetical protein IJ125_09870 [Atopobiaceae bacterium]|nr:hypothetical protein [Atopobiaceae bacterium]
MKRSNYIVYAIAVLASLLLLFLWFHFEFNKIDGPLDILVNALWWGIIAASIFLIVRSEKQRREQVRTIYVSPTAVFNSERGLVPCDASNRVQVMKDILSELTYSLSTKDLPSEGDFSCNYVVRTEDFSKDAGESSWRGSVVRVDNQKGNSIRDFDGVTELSSALS